MRQETEKREAQRERRGKDGGNTVRKWGAQRRQAAGGPAITPKQAPHGGPQIGWYRVPPWRRTRAPSRDF